MQPTQRPSFLGRLLWLTVAALGLAVVLSAAPSRAGDGRVAAKASGAPPAEPPAKAKLLELIMLDVGQGDGLLIRSPEGKVVLLDAGPKSARGAVLASLSALGVTSIDLAIGSHPHEDHIGSMADVVNAIPVKRYMDPGFPHTSVTYQNLLRTLEQKQVPYAQVRRGQQVDLKGGAMLSFFAPEEPFFSGTRSDPNSNSAVARLSLGEFSALLTGDAEHETELRLLSHREDLPQLRASVLKVAHHGGRYSTYADFLDTVAPHIALISVGADNSYGHPAKATLNKLDRRGITTFRTDEKGTVRLRTDGQWIWADALAAPASGMDPSQPPTMASTRLGTYPAAPAATLTQALTPGAEDDDGAASEPDPEDRRDAHHDDAPAAAAGFAASRSSQVFHKASCGNAARISASNLQVYPTREAAIADGKRPAGCCNP